MYTPLFIILLLLFALCTYVFAKRGSYGLAIGFVLLLTATIKIHCASDEYLHQWDERCHALVAKHLIQHPLKPTLYENPVESYDHKNWLGNHVWLMKPPIPLWFMASSIATFGMHEYSVRVPGVLFALASVFLTYLIAKKLFNNEIAILAATLHGIHGLATDLAVGRLSSDAVETCFLFFAELGAFVVFSIQPGKFQIRHYILTGMVTGLAVLSKWQVGYIVLVIMFVYHFEKSKILTHSLYTIISLLSSFLIVVPWILFILNEYPQEATWMMKAIFLPMISGPMDNDATWYSSITDFGNFFGYSIFLLIIISLVLAMDERNQKWRAILVYGALPLVIFSFAEIKRGPYIFVGAPVLFITISYFTLTKQKFSALKKLSLAPLLGYISIASIVIYSAEKLYLFEPHRFDTPEWSTRIKSLKLPKDTVIYNEPHYLEMMFYHDVTAYEYSKPEELEK